MQEKRHDRVVEMRLCFFSGKVGDYKMLFVATRKCRSTLILHLFKTDYQLNDIFPVEITMKNIEIIGRTGTIPFLEMKIQNSYTLEQGILKEFISVTENLGTRKDFGHGMVERDGREKTF